jgi:hypothetical protein
MQNSRAGQALLQLILGEAVRGDNQSIDLGAICIEIRCGLADGSNFFVFLGVAGCWRNGIADLFLARIVFAARVKVRRGIEQCRVRGKDLALAYREFE